MIRTTASILPSVTQPDLPRRRTRWLRTADVVDVLVYVVVLNLAAQLVPVVISESFAMSLVTAVVLKIVLEVVVAVKARVKAQMKAARRPVGKVVFALLLWVVLVGSKFVVLKIEALVFGAYVSLGGFFSVTALIVVMLLARGLVRKALGEPDPLT